MTLSHALRRRHLSALAQRLARLGAVVLAIATIVLGAAHARAQDIPMDRIVAAVCAVESGARWIDTGNIHGSWKRGLYGEVSHWQITAAVLIDLGLSDRQRRKVASDPVYAESIFRLWYARLLLRTGSHAEALAAYNRGLGGIHRRDARDYAQRCLNLATESN